VNSRRREAVSHARSRHLDLERAAVPRSAVVIAKSANRQHRRFVERVGLDLGGVAHTFRIEERNRAPAGHDQDSIMFALYSPAYVFRCYLSTQLG
jgi:hypothetical protein